MIECLIACFAWQYALTNMFDVHKGINLQK